MWWGIFIVGEVELASLRGAGWFASSWRLISGSTQKYLNQGEAGERPQSRHSKQTNRYLLRGLFLRLSTTSGSAAGVRGPYITNRRPDVSPPKYDFLIGRKFILRALQTPYFSGQQKEASSFTAVTSIHHAVLFNQGRSTAIQLRCVFQTTVATVRLFQASTDGRRSESG